MPLTPGQVLNNRYRIVKLLGKGGFGAVYKAWDLQMNEPCAVKENLDSSRQAQFESEAKLLFKLRHQHLPAVHDHFVVPNQGQYLVMDFIEGEDLKQMVERSGPLAEDRAIEWMLQVCAALHYMHTRQPPVIHRDIKPDNIKITPQGGLTGQGEAVLVDFGVAKTLVAGTQSSSIILTPGYAPLEQYGLAKTDARTDVYALGATLYALLTGQPPVEAPLRPVRDPLILPRQLNPGISQVAEQAILKAMQSDPEQRFQSAAELSVALRPAPTPPQPNLAQAVPYSGTLPVAPVRTPAPVFPPAVALTVVPLPPVKVRPAGRKGRLKKAARMAGLILLIVGYLFLAYNWDIFPFLSYFDQYPSPTTATSPVDGMVQALIPAGKFRMGSKTYARRSNLDEHPQHSVYLDAYWIDQTEITNAQYALCVAAGKCQPPSNSVSSSRNSYYGETQFDNYPVIYVSWDDAVAYCAWAGRRLPTEAEWEKAARGAEGKIYPWGNQTPDCNLANSYKYALNQHCVGDTSAVGSYPAGASPYGLFDMAGNVWEWVQDWYDGNYYASSPANNPTGPSSGQSRVLRGGGWDFKWYSLRVAERSAYEPDGRYDSYGFRCAALPGK
jgi:formylglycine-generating enzyme required for sulfatase activity